jgi:hypothetical protein
MMGRPVLGGDEPEQAALERGRATAQPRRSQREEQELRRWRGVPRWPSRHRRLVAVGSVFVIALTASVGILEWGAAAGTPILRLDLTYSRTACCQTIVWINEQTQRPTAVLPIYPGRRATYNVELTTAHVYRIRLDPGSVVRSAFVIHAIWITRNGKIQDRLTLGQVGRFTQYRAQRHLLPDGVRFDALTSQPSVDQFVSLRTGVAPTRLFFGTAAAKPLESLVVALLVGALLVAAIGSATLGAAALVAALGGALLAARLVPHFVWNRHFGSDVTSAVGQATYLGIPKSRDQLILILTTAAAVLVPAFIALTVRVVSTSSSDGTRSQVSNTVKARLEGRTLLLPLCVLGVIAILFAPDLSRSLAAARSQSYLPQWDSNNLLFWDYLIHKGLVPTKDFFYPYGFQSLFSIDAPWGVLISYLNYLAFWAYLILGTFLVLTLFSSGRALLIRCGTVYALILTVALGGEIPEAARYLGSLGVVLLFASLRDSDRAFAPRRILFVIALAHLVLFEAAQAIYALVPIIFLCAFETGCLWRTRQRAARFVALSASSIIAGAGVAVVVLVATARLRGTVDFYAQVRAETVAWGAPSGIEQWIGRPDGLSAYVYWGMLLSFGFGVYALLTWKAPMRSSGAIMLAVALLVAMMMQKQVLRPGIESYIWLPAVFGIVLWFVLMPLDQTRHWASVIAVFGVVSGVIIVSGGYRHGLTSLFHGPARIVRSIDALATDESSFAAVARMRFAPKHLRDYSQDELLASALRKEPAVRAGGRIWTLGEQPATVILLNRVWPYYFDTFYETSPVAWQLKLVRDLERKPPAVVAWNREFRSFDAVPNVVRVPLIFDWAITHLVHKRTVGPFEILRPRRPGEAIPLPWWRAKLGHSVDLGAVPAYTTLGGSTCTDGKDCRDYVVVDFGGEAPVGVEQLRATVNQLPFRIVFRTQAHVSRYIIDLERVWFWNDAPSEAARSVNLSVVGAHVMLVHRRRASTVLY